MNNKLYKNISSRLDKIEGLKPIHDKISIKEKIEEKFGRREFLKWAGGMTAALSLPMTFTPLVARAAELSDRMPIIWLHMAECTGCSEALLRSDAPSIDSLIFDHISLEYHETLMAAAGWSAEHNLEEAMEKHKGKYVLMVEGGIPFASDNDKHSGIKNGDSSNFLTVGGNAHTGAKISQKAVKDAMAVFAIGTCSSFGGIQAAKPNPTSSISLTKMLEKTGISKDVINVPGCPPSEKNIVGTLLNVLLFKTLPATDSYNRPKWAYAKRIHDNCERRGHFDSGRFVEKFGDDGAKQGWCLFKVGCKGPYAYNNCPKVRFNQNTSWPVAAGHGCIACSEPDFWDIGTFHEPMKEGGLKLPWFTDENADSIGMKVVTLTAVGIAIHARLAFGGVGSRGDK